MFDIELCMQLLYYCNGIVNDVMYEVSVHVLLQGMNTHYYQYVVVTKKSVLIYFGIKVI